MTYAEVQFVLDEIAEQHRMAPDLSAVPLERVDRNNSDLLDGSPTHQESPDMTETAYVGVAVENRDRTPIGTDFDYRLLTTVSVRIEAAHVDEMGAIDPQAGTGDGVQRDYPTVQWSTLTDNVVDALHANRDCPSVERENTTYHHYAIIRDQDRSTNYTDYYRRDIDLEFFGYENLS